jgi:hypothetical protein
MARVRDRVLAELEASGLVSSAAAESARRALAAIDAAVQPGDPLAALLARGYEETDEVQLLAAAAAPDRHYSDCNADAALKRLL